MGEIWEGGENVGRDRGAGVAAGVLAVARWGCGRARVLSLICLGTRRVRCGE